MPTEPNPGDIQAYLAIPNEPEMALLRLYDIKASPVILDIGSCEGEDAIRYARRFPKARLFAFEPLPANQALVRANLTRYAVPNVELIPMALSDRAGEAVFHLSSGKPPEAFAGTEWNYGNKSSSLLPPARTAPMHGWIEFKDKITVPTGTLDDFCTSRSLKRIDFIHMDVQGAEHLVIAGAQRMLPATTAVWLEVSDQELYSGQMMRGEIERLMRQHGFTLAFEVRREIEGDQFWLNTRHPRTWFDLARRRLRSAAGRAKRRLFSQTPPP